MSVFIEVRVCRRDRGILFFLSDQMLADRWRRVLEDKPPGADDAKDDADAGGGAESNGVEGASLEDWSHSIMPCTDRAFHTQRSLLPGFLRPCRRVVHPSSVVLQESRPAEPEQLPVPGAASEDCAVGTQARVGKDRHACTTSPPMFPLPPVVIAIVSSSMRSALMTVLCSFTGSAACIPS